MFLGTNRTLLTKEQYDYFMAPINKVISDHAPIPDIVSTSATTTPVPANILNSDGEGLLSNMTSEATKFVEKIINAFEPEVADHHPVFFEALKSSAHPPATSGGSPLFTNSIISEAAALARQIEESVRSTFGSICNDLYYNLNGLLILLVLVTLAIYFFQNRSANWKEQKQPNRWSFQRYSRLTSGNFRKRRGHSLSTRIK